MRITLHRLAAQDLDHALAFYGREAGQGVARRLLDAVEQQLALLDQHPLLGTPTGDGRRCQPLRGFPYSLIYRVDGEQLRVLVLRHQHRDPEFGAARQ
jgi:plasmid stabilization system protein ParE